MNKKPSNHKERISLMDTTQSALAKMSDGNPGAIVFMMGLMTGGEHQKIDPQSALGALGVILSLDSLGIYGTHMYVLFSDICGKDLVKLVTLLRANQLGMISGDILYDISHRQDYSGKEIMPEEKIQELYGLVRSQLAQFNNIDDPRPETQVEWKMMKEEDLIGKLLVFNPTKPMEDLDLPLNIEGILQEITTNDDGKKTFVVREHGGKRDSFINEDEVVSIN